MGDANFLSQPNSKNLILVFVAFLLGYINLLIDVGAGIKARSTTDNGFTITFLDFVYVAVPLILGLVGAFAPI